VVSALIMNIDIILRPVLNDYNKMVKRFSVNVFVKLLVSIIKQHHIED
jgi:hypothetical protein